MACGWDLSAHTRVPTNAPLQGKLSPSYWPTREVPGELFKGNTTNTDLVFKASVLPLNALRRRKSNDWGKKRLLLKDAQSYLLRWSWCRMQLQVILSSEVSHDSIIMWSLIPSASWVRGQYTTYLWSQRCNLATLREGRFSGPPM